MNRKIRGSICTLVGGICWGFSGSCGQYVFSHYEVSSEWMTVIRMLGAGILLLLFCFLRQGRQATAVWHSRKDAFRQVLFAVVGLMASQYTYLTAIYYSNAGTATVLQYIGPVLVMLLVCVTEKKLPDRKEQLAVLLAVGGTFLLATHGNPASMVLTPRGLFWGLMAAVSLVFYTVLPAELLKKYGSLMVTGYGMLIGGIVLACMIRLWTIPVSLDFRGWLAVAGVVIIGTLFAYSLYLQGVSDIGPVRASMLASVEPVTATLLSVFWLGSSFTGMDFVGLVCILSTVFLLTKREKPQHTDT